MKVTVPICGQKSKVQNFNTLPYLESGPFIYKDLEQYDSQIPTSDDTSVGICWIISPSTNISLSGSQYSAWFYCINEATDEQWTIHTKTHISLNNNWHSFKKENWIKTLFYLLPELREDFYDQTRKTIIDQKEVQYRQFCSLLPEIFVIFLHLSANVSEIHKQRVKQVSEFIATIALIWLDHNNAPAWALLLFVA